MGNNGVSNIYERGAEEAGPDGVAPADKQFERPKNIGKLEKDVRGLLKELEAANAAREGANTEVKGILDEIETKGLNRKAFKAAAKLADMSQDERDEYLFTMQFMLERIFKVGWQTDLFGAKDDAETKH